MENGCVKMDFQTDPHHSTQLPASFEGSAEIRTSSSEAESGLKGGLKEQALTGELDASAIVNGEELNESTPSSSSTSAPAVENGGKTESPPLAEEEPATEERTGEAAAPEEAEPEEELDAEGYRVDERRETETLSHTEEITEKPERTELRTREIKEVTMEELKSKETTRPVSLEELKAIMEAEFDKGNNEEVEIGRDIVIEEFSRVESEHEEASGGRVTVATFSVKEERKTQAIKEQLQNAGGAERNGFDGEETGRNVDEVIETVEEFQEVKTPSSEDPTEAFPGVDGAKSEEVAEKTEEAVQKTEEVSGKESDETPDKSEEVAQKSENLPEATEVIPAASGDVEKEKVAAEEQKGEKEHGTKSRGFINYIKVKARSLSRDRGHKRAAAVSAASTASTPADEPGEPTKEASPSKEVSSSKEVSNSKDAGKSSAKKTKQKKWKLFGKKSAGERDDSSSEASASEDEGAAAEKSDKKVKLIAYAKKSDEPREDGDQVASPSEDVAKDDKKPSKEEGKHGKAKGLGFIRMGRQKKEAEHKHGGDDDTKPKAAVENEPEEASPIHNEGEVIVQQEVPETEQTEGGAKKSKENKWFHFGRKTEKESHNAESDDNKTDAVEVKVSENDPTDVVKPQDDVDQHPEVPASDDKTLSPEGLTASQESKGEGQDKVTKEHKKFSFGAIFGKKQKKAHDKSEQRSGKENEANESSAKVEGETSDVTDKVGEVAASEIPISVEDAEKEAVAEAVASPDIQPSSGNIEEGSFGAAVTDDKQPAEEEVVEETKTEEHGASADQSPELPTDHPVDGAYQEVEVETAVETVPEKQVSENVEDDVALEVGQADKEASVDVRAGETFVEAVQTNEVPVADQQDETINSDEKVASVSEGVTEQTSDGLEIKDESKQLDVDEVKDEAGPVKEKKEVVELAGKDSAEQGDLEHINDDAQAPLERAPEVTIEATTFGHDVDEVLKKQTKKFSFGLKMGGQKKDGPKVDEEGTPKHKVWSPFGKKPGKKDKEGGQAAAAVETEKEQQVPKTPDSSADVEHAEESGAKDETPEVKQSESREGTLKRNKGIHKLFSSFGKKSKSVDDKAGGAGESKAGATETNGEAEATALDKPVEGSAPAEKGASEAVEEEKHRHKKFSFGLKFGKKHGDKESGAGDVAKQLPTPTDAEGTGVPAATEPKTPDEEITLHIPQIEIEAPTNESTIKVEAGEPIVSQTEVTGVIVPEVYQIAVTGGGQEEHASGQEILTGELNEAVSSPIEAVSPEVDVRVEKSDEEPDVKLPTVNIETTTAENIKSTSSLDSPTAEPGGSDAFGQPDDSAIVSENEDESIPRTEAKLLEESGVDLEADKPTVEFVDEVNKLVDDIVKSESSDDAKLADFSFNAETHDLKLYPTEEVPEVVVTASYSATTSAGPEDAEVGLPATAAQAGVGDDGPTSPDTGEKPGDVTERVEPVETKTDVRGEPLKEQKQKKHLFGIKFGKKTKQTASKEKIEEHEQNGVAAEQSGGGAPVERTESELSSEPDRVDGKAEEKLKETPNIEEQLIIEVEVREEKDESKPEDVEDKHHHAGGIRWPHFGKKPDKKKDEKETGEHPSRPDEIETAVTEADSTSKPPKGGSTTKKQSHSGGLGKGFLKIFSPKKQLRFDDHSKTNGDSQEPVVVYSIEGEGEVVAETHWRPKQELQTKTAEQHPNVALTEEDTPATNGKISNEEVDGKESAPAATLNGSAHEPEAAVLQVSQSACAEAPSSGVPSPGHFVVVAIDFGTTFSGYAFSFINDPESIHMMRKWEGGDPGVVNQKTPTTILLTPDGSFHSFGFTARDFYHDLEAAEAGRWMYFEKFKMTLHHNTELNKDTTITSSNGKDFPAMRLFSYALRFFKDHALKELTSQSSVTIDNDDVRWVITVPAIWKAPAKQFMRQAAYQAGIASPSTPDRLLIALEPEAASIYVRKLRMSQLVPIRAPPSTLHATPRKETPSPAPPHDEVDNSVTAPDSEHVSDHLKAGTRYMVVDCGGGTVDITVHELETDRGTLKELYKATGGPFGSTGVDQDFEKLLFEIFGSEFIETFKQKRPAGWVDLMIAFESRKRAANPHKDNPLNVSLPFSFIDFYKKQYGNQVDNAIKRFGGDRGVSWSLQGMLRLTPEAMQNLFQKTLDSIISAISDVLSNPKVKGIEYLFLVGGFSESPMLQHELRTAFDDKVRMIIPQDVSLTILKGAVCFGLDPTIVTVRQSRMTYGVGVVNRFDPSRHPDSKRIQKDGTDWCAGIFDTFVASGQPITLGDKVVRRYAPANRDQKTSIIHVYCSESSDVEYVTDPGVQRCATLRLDLVDGAAGTEEDGTGVEPVVAAARREIEATMAFGDTEIRVSARDASTGRNVGSTIDFLNK